MINNLPKTAKIILLVAISAIVTGTGIQHLLHTLTPPVISFLIPIDIIWIAIGIKAFVEAIKLVIQK